MHARTTVPPGRAVAAAVGTAVAGIVAAALLTVAASLALAAVVAGLDEWLRDDGPPPGVRRSVFAFCAAAFGVGAGSHLLADALSAPDVAQPIVPLWPAAGIEVGLDLLYFSSPYSNFGLLAVGVAAHAAAYAVARRRRSASPRRPRPGDARDGDRE